MPRPTMTKSALALARAALHAARRSLPKYSHRFSPKKFTPSINSLPCWPFVEFFTWIIAASNSCSRMVRPAGEFWVLQKCPPTPRSAKPKLTATKKTTLNVCCNLHTVSSARKHGLISAQPPGDWRQHRV